MNDHVLFETAFLSVLERDGYVFSHEKRSNGSIVCVLPFHKGETNGALEFLAHIEIVPAHSREKGIYSITGGVDTDATISETALNELYEEAGYHCTEAELIPLGVVRPSKSADTNAYLYAVNVGGKYAEIPKGDGSFWEDGTYTQWLSFADAIRLSIDPLFIAAVVRLVASLPTGSTSEGD